MTADPLGAANSKNPGSWNQYAYSEGDPINYNDPTGNYACIVGNGDNRQVTNCDDYSDYMYGSPSAYALLYNCYFLGQGCPMQQAVAQSAATQAILTAPAISVVQAKASVLTAGSLAIQALANPSCASLFHDNNSGADAATVLIGILNGTGIASIQYDYLAASNVTFPSTGGVTYQIVNAQVDANNGSPVITINTNSLGSMSFLNPGSKYTATDAAVTLLHELGHVFSAVYGPGSTDIQDDNGFNTGLSPINSDMVKQACFN